MNNPNAQYANQRPMQGVADQMATHGRYGDSMMVHMNPVEVAGLASLSPTGSLTTNPVTGQPEAFLPFLAPLLGGMLGSAGFTALGGALGTGVLGSAATALGANAALAGAVGSGLATTAVTGDLKQGIMSGLTGYGIGRALGGASDLIAGVPEATTALTGAEQALAQGTQDLSQQALSQGVEASALASPELTNLQGNVFDAKEGLMQANVDSMNVSTGDILKDGKVDFAKNLMSKQSILPIAIGEGARAQEMLSDDMRAAGRKRQAEKDAELADAYARRDYAVEMARKDTALNNPYTGAYGYNQGGLTSINPQDYMRQRNNLENMGRAPVQMFEGGGLPYDIGRFNFNRGNAVDTQRSVRPPRVVTGAELEAESAAMVAEGRDPRAGFDSVTRGYP